MTRTFPSGEAEARHTLPSGEPVTLGTFVDFDSANAALLEAQAEHAQGDGTDRPRGHTSFTHSMGAQWSTGELG